jgi:lysophospholipase L1-like esterase
MRSQRFRNLSGAFALAACSAAVEACAAAPPPAPSQNVAAAPLAARQPTGTPTPAPVASVAAPAPSASASAAPAPSASPAAPATPPPLPKDTKVLEIGDSFAGALGIDLDKDLKAAGLHGILRYKTSSYIPEWAYHRKLVQYVRQYKPDLVLITLGANEMRIQNPEQRVGAIRKLVSEAGGVPCVWVGVPIWNDKLNGLPRVIRENVAPCRYLDSTKLYPDMPRMRDHIHPSMAARIVWAKRVLDWLQHQRVPNGDKPWDLKPAPDASQSAGGAGGASASNGAAGER